MSAPHTPWTFEVHELSEGFSAIVYDARGLAIADHLDEGTARLIAAAPDLYEAVRTLLSAADHAGGLGGCDPELEAACRVGSAALAKARGES